MSIGHVQQLPSLALRKFQALRANCMHKKRWTQAARNNCKARHIGEKLEQAFALILEKEVRNVSKVLHG